MHSVVHACEYLVFFFVDRRPIGSRPDRSNARMQPVGCYTTPSRLLYPLHVAPIHTTALVAAGLWPTRPGSRDDETSSRRHVCTRSSSSPDRVGLIKTNENEGEGSGLFVDPVPYHLSWPWWTAHEQDHRTGRPPLFQRDSASCSRCPLLDDKLEAPTPSASAIEPHFTFILQYIGSHDDQGGPDHAVDMCPRLSPATHAGESFLFRSFLPFRSQSASQCGHYIRGRLSQARL